MLTDDQKKPGTGFEVTDLDMSSLVGHQVSIFSDQVPGKELVTRVVSTSGNDVEVDRAGGDGMLANLVTNQRVILQFPYRLQDVSVRAHFRKTEGRRCILTLDHQVTPLSQRHFVRIGARCNVNLATYPKSASLFKGLSDLRWIATVTINLSSGGVAVTLPGFLERDVLVLIHVDMENQEFPSMVLGRVRHCFQTTTGEYHTGVEFLVRETIDQWIPAAGRSILPASVFSYTSNLREKLNRTIQAWQQDLPPDNSGENNVNQV